MQIFDFKFAEHIQGDGAHFLTQPVLIFMPRLRIQYLQRNKSVENGSFLAGRPAGTQRAA